MKWWKVAQARNQQFRRAEQKTEELNATMELSPAIDSFLHARHGGRIGATTGGKCLSPRRKRVKED